MLTQRSIRVLEESMRLIERMCLEHFMTEKERVTFTINNLDFMVS
jgi:hypothetical protein